MTACHRQKGLAIQVFPTYGTLGHFLYYLFFEFLLRYFELTCAFFLVDIFNGMDARVILPEFFPLERIDTTDLIGSHCDLLSGNAAKIMVPDIEYQIDLHMSKILRKKCALHVYDSRHDAGIQQDPISTVQYYSLPGSFSLYKILDRKFPSSHIFSFCKPWYEYNCL